MPNANATSIAPNVVDAARTAWTRYQRVDRTLRQKYVLPPPADATFASAIAGLPPCPGAQGWPMRWAAAATKALVAAIDAEQKEAAQRRWEAKQAEENSPIWGVEKEYGCGYWSHAYSYQVRIGAGTMTRREAEDAKAAAFAADGVARFHAACWDDR